MTEQVTAEQRGTSSLLADLRHRSGMSQEELAEAAGIGVRTLRDIERGVAARPRRDTVRRLAEALELADHERARFEAHFRGESTSRWLEPAPPRQLPHDVTAFGGRQAELDQLDAVLADDVSAPRTAAALVGTGGVGKSALAVRWAHRAADRFPDGQLWIDLRGFDPDRRPVDPAEALARFLRALGVDSEAIPADTDEREALYRSLLDGRRLLVVLDNAHDSAQVSRLLPGSSTCRTLVTSRDSLTGLVARDGAYRLAVDALPMVDAVNLLESLIGERALDDPNATAAVAECCARIPLALRIAAELAGLRREPVSALADSLADTHRRLDLLDAGADERTAIRAVFSWSYQHLTDDAATAFRLLGLHPGTEIDTYAVGALLDLDPVRTRQILDRLIQAHLVDETRPGRFAMHDLLRAWAAELVRRHDADWVRNAALTRLFDHYRYTTRIAAEFHDPTDSHRIPDLDAPGSATPPIATRDDATRWLEDEQSNLLRIAVAAAEDDRPEYVSHLSILLFRYLEATAADQEAAKLHALAARVTTGRAKALAVNRLGVTYLNLGRYTDAANTFQTTIDLSRESGDSLTRGVATGNLGLAYDALGRFDEAIEQHREALALSERTGGSAGPGHNNLGMAYSAVGDYDRALRHLGRSLDIARERRDRIGESRALGNLGEVHMCRGRLDEAIRHHLADLAITRELGNRPRECLVAHQLGLVYIRLGRGGEAVERLEEALEIAHSTGRRKYVFKVCNDLADALRESGDHEAAMERFEMVIDSIDPADGRYERARAIAGIGHVLHERGDIEGAREHWREALAAYEQMQLPEAEPLRRRLLEIGG